MMTTAQQHAATDDMAVFGMLTKAREDQADARDDLGVYLDACMEGKEVFSFTHRTVCAFKDACSLVAFHSGKQVVVDLFDRDSGRTLRAVPVANFDHAAEAQALAGIRLDLKTSEVVA